MDRRDVLPYQGPLKQLLWILHCASSAVAATCCAVFLLILAAYLMSDGTRDLQYHLTPLPPCLALLGGAVFLGWLHRQLQLEYCLDHELQQLMVRRTFMRFTTIQSVAHFDDLHCLTVDGKSCVTVDPDTTQVHLFSWSTALFLITRNGLKIRVTDFLPNRCWDGGLADRLGIPFLGAPKKGRWVLQIRGPAGDLKVVHLQDRFIVYASEIWRVLVCLVAPPVLVVSLMAGLKFLSR